MEEQEALSNLFRGLIESSKRNAKECEVDVEEIALIRGSLSSKNLPR